MLWGLQHCGHNQETGFPKKEATPPVSGLGSGDTGMVGDGFPRVQSTGAVTGTGAQVALVVVIGGCHALSWELREASVATPQGPGLVITGGRDQSTRPRSPSGQETTGSCPNQQILSNNNVNRYVLRLIELFLLGKQLLFSRGGVFLHESSWF